MWVRVPIPEKRYNIIPRKTKCLRYVHRSHIKAACTLYRDSALPDGCKWSDLQGRKEETREPELSKRVVTRPRTTPTGKPSRRPKYGQIRSSVQFHNTCSMFVNFYGFLISKPAFSAWICQAIKRACFKMAFDSFLVTFRSHGICIIWDAVAVAVRLCSLVSQREWNGTDKKSENAWREEWLQKLQRRISGATKAAGRVRQMKELGWCPLASVTERYVGHPRFIGPPKEYINWTISNRSPVGYVTHRSPCCSMG